MEDLKSIIAENIVALRKGRAMTQIELAEKLNYSDKAISKWERGESVPDITVLKAIADTFGVTVDYLISKEHDEVEAEVDTEAQEQREREEKEEQKREKKARLKKTHSLVAGMSVLLVWLIAVLLFIILDAALNDTVKHLLVFPYAVVVSTIVWLVFNSMWFNQRRNYLIISLMMWSATASVHISVLAAGPNFWQIYLLGIPGQIIILLWSIIGKKS